MKPDASTFDLITQAWWHASSRRRATLAQWEKRKARRQRHDAEFRCTAGCLLLGAWNSPQGICWYAPPGRISAAAATRMQARHILTADEVSASGRSVKSGGRSDLLFDSSIPILCRHAPPRDLSITAAEIAQAVKLGLEAGHTYRTIIG